MKILIVLGLLIYSNAALAKCEKKPVGEMLRLLDPSDARHHLDYDGVERLNKCLSNISIDGGHSTPEVANAADACKKAALKYSFYDADPKSRDLNRKVTRGCGKPEPGVVEEADKSSESSK